MNTIDRLAHSNRLARASAAEKMLFSMGMLVLAVTLPPWPGAVVVLVVVLVAILGVARVPVRAYLGLIAGPALFMAVSMVPLLLTLSFGGPVCSTSVLRPMDPSWPSGSRCGRWRASTASSS